MTSEIPQIRTTYVVRKLDGVEADKTRADVVRLLLRRMIDGLKAKLDPASWVNGGWAELEAFTEALCGDGIHPALQECATKGGRPAPLSRERYARRLVVLLCESLERAGLSKRAAREFAAQELAAAGVFESAPSCRTIEYWQQNEPVLAPGDELLVATGFAATGGEPAKLAIYFVGLCHLALNPTAVAVREGSGKRGDYLANFRER